MGRRLICVVNAGSRDGSCRGHIVNVRSVLKKSITILFAVFALITAADANASALLVAHHATHATLRQIRTSQLENIKHNRYVCRQGGGWNQIRSCKALRWLKREYKETQAKLHPRVAASYDIGAWTCIHNYEGAWNSNTGNGYYGGLQMDYGFMSTYGSDFMQQWGTADNWPAWAQIEAARRARDSGRGYHPWPNTAHFCGLI